MIRKLKNIIALVAIAAVSGYSGAYLFNQNSKPFFNGQSISAKNASAQPVKINYASMPVVSPDGAPVDFVKAAEASVHAVVHVKTTTINQNRYFDPFGNFFGNSQPREQQGFGSGVIITADGYIVTNNHVVAGAEKVEVTLNDNRSFTAKVVGTDPSTDLALLRINEKDLPYMVYGNSDDVKVGEWVLAVGNPFNLTSTVTAGIISAKARNIGILPEQNKIESYLQTDAAVNPGNSGGALVNTRGELIGINSAIASSTGAYAGYAFAVPVNLVRKVMDDLVEFGSVQRGFIGISIRDVDSKLAQEKGLKDARGIYVAGLSEGGAAKSAGLQEGDVITKVGEVEVNTVPQLQEQVGRYRPGDKIKVTAFRNGTEKDFVVTLRNEEGTVALTKAADNSASLNLLGGTFSEVTKEDKSNLGISGGAKISRLNPGKLRAAGIQQGFIITSVDKKPIHTITDLENALKDKQGGVLLEGIYPNGMRSYYGFGL